MFLLFLIKMFATHLKPKRRAAERRVGRVSGHRQVLMVAIMMGWWWWWWWWWWLVDDGDAVYGDGAYGDGTTPSIEKIRLCVINILFTSCAVHSQFTRTTTTQLDIPGWADNIPLSTSSCSSWGSWPSCSASSTLKQPIGFPAICTLLTWRPPALPSPLLYRGSLHP